MTYSLRNSSSLSENTSREQLAMKIQEQYEKKNREDISNRYCSECGAKILEYKYIYCPICGKKLKGIGYE